MLFSDFRFSFFPFSIATGRKGHDFGDALDDISCFADLLHINLKGSRCFLPTLVALLKGA